MSAVKKTAKASLLIFSVIVFMIIGGAVYLYVNMSTLLGGFIEEIASDSLGVKVSIGDIDITYEELKVVVNDIRIGNPSGYKRSDSININSIVVDAKSLDTQKLVFDRIEVNKTNVNLEVGKQGTNLGDIKKNIDKKSKPHKEKKESAAENVKVIVKNVYVRKAQLNPSVTLLDSDLSSINVPDIHIRGVGEKENGILAKEAISQILGAIIVDINKAAGQAGFLEGLSIDAMKEMGVEKIDSLKKGLQETINQDSGNIKKELDNMKGLFSR